VAAGGQRGSGSKSHVMRIAMVGGGIGAAPEHKSVGQESERCEAAVTSSATVTKSPKCVRQHERNMEEEGMKGMQTSKAQSAVRVSETRFESHEVAAEDVAHQMVNRPLLLHVVGDVAAGGQRGSTTLQSPKVKEGRLTRSRASHCRSGTRAQKRWTGKWRGAKLQ
jgi:hypothetical protein